MRKSDQKMMILAMFVKVQWVYIRVSTAFVQLRDLLLVSVVKTNILMFLDGCVAHMFDTLLYSDTVPFNVNLVSALTRHRYV